MAIVIGLFLASLCVIKKVRYANLLNHLHHLMTTRSHFQRQEEERFKKIDAKRGGHGFA